MSAANAATPADTPGTIVKRDSNGNFAAGAITASSVSGDGSRSHRTQRLRVGKRHTDRRTPFEQCSFAQCPPDFHCSNTFNAVLNATNINNNFVGTFSGDGAALSNLFVRAANVLGTLSATQLIGPLPADLLVGTYTNALSLNNPANSYTGNGAGLTGVNADLVEGLGAASFWQLGGNAGTTAGSNFLGTTDDQPLELKVNGQRAYRFEPTAGAPNVIGGPLKTRLHWGPIGVTISGGYSNLAGMELPVNFVTLGGGASNTIYEASDFSTISGGVQNTLSTDSAFATISGGDKIKCSGPGPSTGAQLTTQSEVAGPIISG